MLQLQSVSCNCLNDSRSTVLVRLGIHTRWGIVVSRGYSIDKYNEITFLSLVMLRIQWCLHFSFVAA